MSMSKQAHGYAKDVVDKGAAILGQDPKAKGSITVYHDFLKFAKSNHIGYAVARVHPNEMMCSAYNQVESAVFISSTASSSARSRTAPILVAMLRALGS